MSANPQPDDALARLREELGAVRAPKLAVLPFGIDAIDTRLAEGGLVLGGLHEVLPATPTLTDDAAATLFWVGIAARAAARSGRRVL